MAAALEERLAAGSERPEAGRRRSTMFGVRPLPIWPAEAEPRNLPWARLRFGTGVLRSAAVIDMRQLELADAAVRALDLPAALTGFGVASVAKFIDGVKSVVAMVLDGLLPPPSDGNGTGESMSLSSWTRAAARELTWEEKVMRSVRVLCSTKQFFFFRGVATSTLARRLTAARSCSKRSCSSDMSPGERRQRRERLPSIPFSLSVREAIWMVGREVTEGRPGRNRNPLGRKVSLSHEGQYTAVACTRVRAVPCYMYML